MKVKEILLKNSSFAFENNIFYHRKFERGGEFEKKYLDLREREGRIYTDEIVMGLPDIPFDHPLSKEWRYRKATLSRLLHYLADKNAAGSILEMGCGNGWLAHHLAVATKCEVMGLDINARELLQGSRIFEKDKNLFFVYADIFEWGLTEPIFDFVILSSSMQYFPDPKKLLKRLLELLKPSGEIHIVDSPWYKSKADAKNAQSRSIRYFRTKGVTEMADKYYHHTTAELKDFSYCVLYNPYTIIRKFKRKILKLPDMSFPWILIGHH